MVEDVPELEITDGWYRLRAEVDGPLARAIRRGVIRAGRKVGVVDAKVCNLAERIPRHIDRGSACYRPQGTLRDPRGLRQCKAQPCWELNPPRPVAYQIRF